MATMKQPAVSIRPSVFLQEIPIFQGLPGGDVAELRMVMGERNYRRNDVILFEEDTPRCLYVIYEGRVKVAQIDEEGREQILAVHKRGDFFGEMALLDGKTSPARVIALEDTRVGFLGRADFEMRFLKNPIAVRQIISLLCERLRDSWFMLKVLNLQRAEDRVRAVLGHMASRFGSRDARGTAIRLRMTHSELADYASLSRETVSRILKRLELAGEISVLEKRRILITPNFHKVDFV
ncbi:MAG TPA: Crp/Fnr family transcriptional regulator [Syntrophales bacterium]|nr:Crp/Fnr family transcriptional regulator [Syntrophales bacterium]